MRKRILCIAAAFVKKVAVDAVSETSDWYTYQSDGYSCAAEPPVQYRLSHLSRRSEPLIKHTICMMRIYSRNALSNPYTSRMEISCSASMLVMLMR